MRKVCRIVPLFSVLLFASAALAEPTLPVIFGDHMVVQRNAPVPVWGTADAGEQITVAFRGQSKSATAAADGKWTVNLDATEAGGPFELTVKGKTTVTFKDVLVGEVWICSGQSNMEWVLKNTIDAEKAIAESSNPNLRHFTLPKAVADTPQANCKGQWFECNPTTSPGFTAVGYYFGLKLQKELNVPVGLIHTSWGGTRIEPWTSRKALEADPQVKTEIVDVWQKRLEQHQAALAKFKEEADKAKKEGKPAPKAPRGPGQVPSSIYNAMIAPLVPYRIAGAIWYQGESNAGEPIMYRKLMPLMIKNWRDDFGHEFPFFMVSLANFMARQPQPSDTNWAWLREAQAMSTTALPKVGQAIAIDVGDAKDIHPRDKKTVGDRLALNALAIAYGRQIEYSGPVYESMKVEGDKVRLSFKHAASGLAAKGEKLVGFAIAGEDKKFVWADAVIDGNTVLVSSKEVSKPVAVRYAWADNPECNLYNKENLPCVPFRTDDWMRPGLK